MPSLLWEQTATVRKAKATYAFDALSSLTCRLAINVYRGYSTFVDTHWGGFNAYVGVPNAWGFLMFCAGWTILVVVFQLVAGNALTDRPLVGYVRVAVEVVALLSWLASWISVAISIGTMSCTRGCGALKTATVFGAIEWLLFMVTTFLAISLFLNSKRRVRTTTT